ncbi:hypothetical protein BOA8489_00552 [Boseongicola aestuarii]|uniref:Uncharacterized protein n=1 Tax=Boseongicola aestuarii TaxID=1470561 RepID=A0A238IVQ3_9RHOB|nr:hypothetical protein BOA8489_00552 [Boseongicola aestuarii]
MREASVPRRYRVGATVRPGDGLLRIAGVGEDLVNGACDFLRPRSGFLNISSIRPSATRRDRGGRGVTGGLSGVDGVQSRFYLSDGAIHIGQLVEAEKTKSEGAEIVRLAHLKRNACGNLHALGGKL